MKLDDLRSILLTERETGRLTVVAPDMYEKGHAELAGLRDKVYALEDPLTDEARALIEETLAIRETIHDIFVIRSRKILALTITHAEGNYYDRDEVKRMIPPEKEMFENIASSIEECQRTLLHNVPYVPAIESEEPDGGGEPVAEGEIPAVGVGQDTAAKPGMPFSHPCAVVRVLEDMESFMGVDGRIYSLSKGDIVTLPERNATVLSERNIVLNINLCK
jgi:DNA replication factor GINS